jgi:replicative DNA helicase
MAEAVAQPPPRRPRAANGASDVALPLGRTLPHSVEAEEYLLSCCLLDGSDTIARCLEAKVSPAAFYVPANRTIYEKLCEIYQTRPPVDLAVLAEELKTQRLLDGIGGYAYLTQISSRIPTTAQAQYFIEKVR